MDTTQITMYISYVLVVGIALVAGQFGYIDSATTGGIVLLVIGNFLGLHIPSPQQNKLLERVTKQAIAEKE